ncbi:hypothetical protein P9112_009580 [Eukaryota sp. TZLM1-RC]
MNGSVIKLNNGYYNVIEKIGDGAYASVYKASKVTSSSQYALKIMSTADPDRQSLFQQEISMMKHIGDHPNIASLHDSYIETSSSSHKYYLLLDLCSPITSFTSLSTSPLPDATLLHLVKDLSLSLHHLHSLSPPVIHRDIKLENTLQQGNSFKLCDFGSATTSILTPSSRKQRLLIESEVSKLTTPAYRSPEMVDVYRNIDIGKPSDIWAFGVLVYVFAFGKFPFGDGSNKLAIMNKKLMFPKDFSRPEVIYDVINGCLERNVEKRCSANDLLNILGLSEKVEVLRCSHNYPFDFESQGKSRDDVSIGQKDTTFDFAVGDHEDNPFNFESQGKSRDDVSIGQKDTTFDFVIGDHEDNPFNFESQGKSRDDVSIGQKDTTFDFAVGNYEDNPFDFESQEKSRDDVSIGQKDTTFDFAVGDHEDNPFNFESQGKSRDDVSIGQKDTTFDFAVGDHEDNPFNFESQGKSRDDVSIGQKDTTVDFAVGDHEDNPFNFESQGKSRDDVSIGQKDTTFDDFFGECNSVETGTKSGHFDSFEPSFFGPPTPSKPSKTSSFDCFDHPEPIKPQKKVPLFFQNDFIDKLQSDSHEIQLTVSREPSPELQSKDQSKHQSSDVSSRSQSISHQFTKRKLSLCGKEDSVDHHLSHITSSSRSVSDIAGSLLSVFSKQGTVRSSIIKATDSSSNSPKCKHIRSIIIGLYENPIQNPFQFILSRISNNKDSEVICLKSLYLCMYLLQEGPRDSTKKLREVFDTFETSMASNWDALLKFIEQMLSFRLKEGCFLEGNLSLDTIIKTTCVRNQHKLKSLRYKPLEKWMEVYQIVSEKLGSSFLLDCAVYLNGILESVMTIFNLVQMATYPYLHERLVYEVNSILQLVVFCLCSHGCCQEVGSNVRESLHSSLSLLSTLATEPTTLELCDALEQCLRFNAPSQYKELASNLQVRPNQSLDADIRVAAVRDCVYLSVDKYKCNK